VMQQEIFGPLLPVVAYDTLDQALHYINERPRPLALYYFGMSGKSQRKVLEHTHSGGVCINDTLLHVAVDDIPFGGVGSSGMGHYHGREGFLTLSKAKGVFSKGRLNSSKLIYPPYKAPILKLLFGLFIR
jgi:coniferyl-aldehyde dehydrogenase